MFEVDDRVFCKEFDEGIITDIDYSKLTYPITVTFNGILRFYTMDGYYTYDKEQYVEAERYKITKLENTILKDARTYLAANENLSWQEPKRTFTLNGEELPLPASTDEGVGSFYYILDMSKVSWGSMEERDRVQEALEKLLNGK